MRAQQIWWRDLLSHPDREDDRGEDVRRRLREGDRLERRPSFGEESAVVVGDEDRAREDQRGGDRGRRRAKDVERGAAAGRRKEDALVREDARAKEQHEE